MSDSTQFDPRRKKAIRDLVVMTAQESSPRRGRRGRVAVIASLIVFAVGLSGGVAYALGTGLLEPDVVGTVRSDVPSDTPSPSSATPSVAPTTPPSPPMADPSDPSVWLIDFDGVGPATLGRSFEEQRQTLPGFDDTTDSLCVDSYLRLQAPSGLPLLFVGSEEQSGATAAIELSSTGSTVTDLRQASPKTAAGIGLGSSEQELLAAYPGIEQTGGYIDPEAFPYYGLTDGNGGWIVFGIIDHVVDRIQVANEADLPIGNRSVKTLPGERCPA
jgi:hypothetical protein